MHILVTGGLGFIGSHVVVELLTSGHTVVIIDNLSNAHLSTLDNIKEITQLNPTFLKVNMQDKLELESIFRIWSFECVIHLAGSKSVPESISNPLAYYQNNLISLLNLLDVMTKYEVHNLIFSSSATVYGSGPSPMMESSSVGIGLTNPYGKSKYMQEEILKDFQKANPMWTVVILRYFNPVGAHASGLLAENPAVKPNNLMPYLVAVADSIYPFLQIYGSDYNTPDGTCIRDFVHVIDLAKGHTAALQLVGTFNETVRLIEDAEVVQRMALNNSRTPGTHIYNLGTGVGHSVKEVVDTFQVVNDMKLKLNHTSRRPGDIAVSYADVTKARTELGWQSELDLAAMCRDSWKAHQVQKKLI